MKVSKCLYQTFGTGFCPAVAYLPSLQMTESVRIFSQE